MGNLVFSLAKMALVLLLAPGLGTSAFAHRGLNQHDAMREAYALSGGDLANLCGGHGHAAKTDCPACQIAGTALPPAPLGFVRAADPVLVAPRENRAGRVVLDSANGLRAPPQA